MQPASLGRGIKVGWRVKKKTGRPSPRSAIGWYASCNPQCEVSDLDPDFSKQTQARRVQIDAYARASRILVAHISPILIDKVTPSTRLQTMGPTRREGNSPPLIHSIKHTATSTKERGGNMSEVVKKRDIKKASPMGWPFSFSVPPRRLTVAYVIWVGSTSYSE